MANRVALIAYVAMCLAIAGCAIYLVMPKGAPAPAPVLDLATAERKYREYDQRRRQDFRDDVRDAVGSALQVYAATGGRVRAEPPALDEVYAGRADLVRGPD